MHFQSSEEVVLNRLLRWVPTVLPQNDFKDMAICNATAAQSPTASHVPQLSPIQPMHHKTDGRTNNTTLGALTNSDGSRIGSLCDSHAIASRIATVFAKPLLVVEMVGKVMNPSLLRSYSAKQVIICIYLSLRPHTRSIARHALILLQH